MRFKLIILLLRITNRDISNTRAVFLGTRDFLRGSHSDSSMESNSDRENNYLTGYYRTPDSMVLTKVYVTLLQSQSHLACVSSTLHHS